MVKDNQHVKIGRNSGKSYATRVTSTEIPSSEITLFSSNTATLDEWTFDVQWDVYPQLEGKLRLFLTCNPDFPEFKAFYGTTTVDYFKVKVAPVSEGYEKKDEDGEFRWYWNENADFSINKSLSETKLKDGKPTVWSFPSNPGVEYCVHCVYGNSAYNNKELASYGTFIMPPVCKTPALSSSADKKIKVTVKDDNTSVTALEFHNASSPPSPWSNYDDETRALFFEAACQATEDSISQKYFGGNFKIWEKKEHTIGVNFMSSVSEDMRETFKAYVEQSISVINAIIGSSGFSLSIIDGKIDGKHEDIAARSGIGEIQLWWGNYEELWDMSPPDDWRYFGQWYNNAYKNGKYITEGWVKLCTEKVWTMNFQGITFEEIVECLGVGNDVIHNTYSLFSEYWFPAKSLDKYMGTLTPYENDLNVLRMAYNHDLPSNIPPWDCANRIYAPNGYFYNEYEKGNSGLELFFDVNCLNAGNTYKFKAISLSAVDSSGSSPFTNEISYTIPGSGKWVWSSSIAKGEEIPLDSEGLHPITATEWNNFTARINEFRAYRGVSNYDFTQVEPGDDFTPDIYNEAVNAIKGVSGYGTYVSFISADTLAVNNNVFPITLFTSLSNEANALGGHTN